VQLSYIINQLESFGVQVDFVGSGQTEILQVAGLDHAQPNHISFLNDKKYLSSLRDTHAGAVILSPTYRDNCTVARLIVDNPYYVYALVAQILNPNPIEIGIHCDSTVDSTAVIAETACVKAQAVVQSGVVIGQSTLIGSGAVIEHDVQIGEHCRIGSNVVICHHCIIGDGVIIEAGAVIGGDGFGWASHQGKWHKIPQVGRVIIGHHVSIGNNVCIDRGAIEDTVIADNCIIDNLVHIAHNVKIGEGSAIAGQSGFAGSTSLGAHCTVAGQVGFAGHLNIADNIHFLAKAGVTHNLDKPGAYAGFPAIPVLDWQKNSVRARNLDKMSKQIKRLQKQLDALSKA
jgi:UDP-3-O-[3-hydroxymyristoyl] glucosamine N-acyltransferase